MVAVRVRSCGALGMNQTPGPYRRAHDQGELQGQWLARENEMLRHEIAALNQDNARLQRAIDFGAAQDARCIQLIPQIQALQAEIQNEMSSDINALTEMYERVALQKEQNKKVMADEDNSAALPNVNASDTEDILLLQLISDKAALEARCVAVGMAFEPWKNEDGQDAAAAVASAAAAARGSPSGRGRCSRCRSSCRPSGSPGANTGSRTRVCATC